MFETVGHFVSESKRFINKYTVYSILHCIEKITNAFFVVHGDDKLSSWVTKIQDVFCPILDYLLLQVAQG